MAYVDNNIVGTGHFDKAAIVSYDFSGVEAASSGFNVSQQEIYGLSSVFSNPDSAFTNGFTVGGEKYLAIKADNRSLYGKKGKTGIIVVRAVSCSIVAHHPEHVQTTNAATIIEQLVDYINQPR